MSITSKPTLLPVGKDIEHNGMPLHIQERLSSGLTGEVYKGVLTNEEQNNIPVAIKVMKTLEFPMAYKLFLQEGETLSHMMYLEQEANEKQQLALKVAPIYYGMGEFGDVPRKPYFVMEFIDGIEIPKLLRENGRFSESQALIAGWHLYRTLDIMHTRLKKTYIDLKFNNLWWVQEKNIQGQLKLTDFGTLEEIRSEDKELRGIKRDLLLAGVYLFDMLTGHLLEYSLGKLLERAEPKIREADLSWGTKRLLGSILHRNPDKRLTQASIVANELQTLIKFWSQPVEKLIGVGESLMNYAEAENDPSSLKARDFASRTMSALSIITLRPPYDEARVQDLQARAEHVLAISDYYERGKALFMGRSYTLARKTFEEGMHWNDEPARLRHWAYLARIGEEISPSVFDEKREEVLQILERMGEENWQAAEQRLRSLSTALDSTGLAALLAEVQLSRNLNEASLATRQEDFLTAAQSYRMALEALSRLPDAEFVRREEVGDLLRIAEDMEVLNNTRGTSSQLLAEAEQSMTAGDTSDALEKVREAYSLDSQNPQLAQRAHSFADIAVQKGHFGEALQLAEISVMSLSTNSSYLTTMKLAAQLSNAQDIFNSGDQELFRLVLIDVLENFREIPGRLPALQFLLSKAGKPVSQCSENSILDAINQLEEEQENQLRKAVDRLLARATQLVLFDELLDLTQLTETEKEMSNLEHQASLASPELPLERARSLVADALRIADSIRYRQKDAIELKDRISQELERYKSDAKLRSDRQATELLEKTNALGVEWQNICRFAEHKAKISELNIRTTINQALCQQLETDLMDFIVKCYEFLNYIDPDNESVQAMVEESARLMDGHLGTQGWQAVRQLASEHLEKINSQFAEAKSQFVRGDWSKAAGILETLKPSFRYSSDWEDLNTQIKLAQNLELWVDRNKDILSSDQPHPELIPELRKFLEIKLPAVYFKPAHVYLEKAEKITAQRLLNLKKSYRNPEFMQCLREWIEVVWTIRIMEALG